MGDERDSMMVNRMKKEAEEEKEKGGRGEKGEKLKMMGYIREEDGRCRRTEMGRN